LPYAAGSRHGGWYPDLQPGDVGERGDGVGHDQCHGDLRASEQHCDGHKQHLRSDNAEYGDLRHHNHGDLSRDGLTCCSGKTQHDVRSGEAPVPADCLLGRSEAAHLGACHPSDCWAARGAALATSCGIPQRDPPRCTHVNLCQAPYDRESGHVSTAPLELAVLSGRPGKNHARRNQASLSRRVPACTSEGPGGLRALGRQRARRGGP